MFTNNNNYDNYAFHQDHENGDNNNSLPTDDQTPTSMNSSLSESSYIINNLIIQGIVGFF